MKYRFKDGKVLDMSDFKGTFTYEDIKTHFGEEIADTIMLEVTEQIHKRFGVFIDKQKT